MNKNNRKQSVCYKKALSALNMNDMERFRQAVQEMPNIDELDNYGRSISFYALMNDNLSALEILKSEGADFFLQDNNGWTLLHFAADRYLLDVAKFLISNEVDVNSKDNYGNTVISRATFSSKGKGEMIRLLLASGADPSIKNNSGVSAINLANLIANHNVKQFFEKS